jgi:hypothetical protein
VVEVFVLGIRIFVFAEDFVAAASLLLGVSVEKSLKSEVE